MTNLLTVDDVASRFRVSRRQVYRLIDRGILKVVKIGRLTRFLPSVVEDAMKRLEEDGEL